MALFIHSLKYCFQNNIFYNWSFIDNLESTMENALPGKTYIRELYGAANLVLSPDEIVDGTAVIVKDQDGFLNYIGTISFDIIHAETKLYELKQVCESAGTKFAYISFPSKINDQITFDSYGIDTNQEQTREAFLARLDTYGIPVCNVRALLEADGYSVKDIFYKTDHHWKSTAGLYGARAIANYLNDTFGYSLRTDLLDEDLFTYTTFHDLWLGETGRMCSKTWAGALDDFTEIIPVYDTSLQVGAQWEEYDHSGNFSMLIDESGYGGNQDLYTYSAHYSYGKVISSPTWLHNNNVHGQKILIIKDSFSMVVIPFLLLSTSDIAVWDMRITKEGLYDYIAKNDFDIVLVAYTDFWRPDMYSFN